MRSVFTTVELFLVATAIAGCIPQSGPGRPSTAEDVAHKIIIDGQYYDTVHLAPRLAKLLDACVERQPTGDAAAKCQYWASAHQTCEQGDTRGDPGIAPYVRTYVQQWCRVARARAQAKKCPPGSVRYCDNSTPRRCACRCRKGLAWHSSGRYCGTPAKSDLNEKRVKVEAGLRALSNRAAAEIRSGRCAAGSIKLLRFLQKHMSPSRSSNYLFQKRQWLVAKPSGAKYTYRTGLSGVRRIIVVAFGPTSLKMKDGQGYPVQDNASMQWEPSIWRTLLAAGWIGTKTADQLAADSTALQRLADAIRDWARDYGGLKKALSRMGGVAARWGQGSLADGRQVRTNSSEKLELTVQGSGCVMLIELTKWR